MGDIPNVVPKASDLVDVLIESAKVIREIPQDGGPPIIDSYVDPEVIWCKTGSVNSNMLADCVTELKEWERQAEEAYNYMTKPRADKLANTILGYGKSVRRGIDAKSSESQRDKFNSQSTYIDKINRNKIERVHTVKGEMKKTFADALLGREGTREAEED